MGVGVSDCDGFAANARPPALRGVALEVGMNSGIVLRDGAALRRNSDDAEIVHVILRHRAGSFYVEQQSAYIRSEAVLSLEHHPA